MASKPVRISNETMSLLKKHAEPFESPDECMKRILSTNPCNSKKPAEDLGETEKKGESQDGE